MAPSAELQGWPEQLQINAYTGEGRRGASGQTARGATGWSIRNAPIRSRSFLRPAPIADPKEWRDPRVGWGLILPEKPGLSEADLASGDDAPEPIRQLLKERNGIVLRYRGESQHRYRFLRSYRDGKDIAVSGAPAGTTPGSLPRYLLIYAGPADVPWELQFLLNANASCSVGRLDLDGDALENHVTALLADWATAASTSRQALVWSVNHDPSDITATMRDVIAKPVFDRLAGDGEITATFLDGAAGATRERLQQTLTQKMPGLIVTTSHGQTGPLENIEAMGRNLGLLVDQDYRLLQPSDLLNGWAPDGAIWYAHACCSAGSDAETHFDGLLDESSSAQQVLSGVAKVGSCISPLPKALLGASKPLRAFIGHVEPTFDWTLVDPRNSQVLTDSIQRALYQEMFQPKPIGLALRPYYDRLGSLYGAYDANLEAFNRGDNTRAAMLYFLLAARDTRSMVILGDPTAMLPAL